MIQQLDVPLFTDGKRLKVPSHYWLVVVSASDERVNFHAALPTHFPLLPVTYRGKYFVLWAGGPSATG
jgi:hypothetical protein